MDREIRQLNEAFPAGGAVVFRSGQGGLTVAGIANDHATATVALHGGQVLAYRPRDHEPVLWVSRCSRFRVGHPIRGGIPICWPWFSSHPTDKSKPFHGFARLKLWNVLDTVASCDGTTQIRLGLKDDEATHALWPCAFDLQILVTVGSSLRAELVMRNAGSEPWTCTCALHTYFAVGDVTGIVIHGFEGCQYVQGGPERRTQGGAIRIDRYVDRVYLDTTAECTIDDPTMGRRIRVAREGSRSAVVWNPWIENAARFDDFGDDEYLGMVCVETTNWRHDAVEVLPGGEHRVATVISAEKT